MLETQYNPHDSALGTSGVTGLLFPPQLQAIRMIAPRDMEKVFGPGIKVDMPQGGMRGWYFKTSDGNIFGIGWRRGEVRLRARGKRGTKKNHLQLRHPSQAQATAFVEFLMTSLGDNK